ncbi:MAG: type I methionyl aminopeptidase [Patescibacteria group bacterium]
MFKLKTKAEIEILRRGGRELSRILNELTMAVAPGVTTLELDALAREKIAAIDAKPSFLNYRPVGARRPFPAALCVSVNEEVVHGIPSDRALVSGDIVTLDLGLEFEGMYTDMALTVPVGEVSTEARRLITVTAEALKRGVAAARPGGRLGDLGAAIEAYVLAQGFDLVRDFGGHGVGFRVHEEPEVPNYGTKGKGEKLVSGLVIAIEPMVVVGEATVSTMPDGYTVKTRDGSLAAHFEQTVAITERGVEVLTP